LVVLRKFDGVAYVNVTGVPRVTDVAEAVSAGVVAAAVLAASAAELPCTAPNAARAVTATQMPRALMPPRALRRAPGGRSAMVQNPRFTGKREDPNMFGQLCPSIDLANEPPVNLLLDLREQLP
jgi:hypothetical protein